MYTTEISPTQNRKIWCKHIYPARQLMIDYIMEQWLSGWVNVYHAWLKNIISWQVTSLCPIMLSPFHLRLPETAYIYSSASFLVTAWWQHFGFKMIFRFMTSIELLLRWVLLQAYPCLSSFLPYMTLIRMARIWITVGYGPPTHVSSPKRVITFD